MPDMADRLRSHSGVDVSRASARTGGAPVPGKHTLVEQLGPPRAATGHEAAPPGEVAGARPGGQDAAAGAAETRSPPVRLDRLFGYRNTGHDTGHDAGHDAAHDRPAPSGGLPPALRSQLEGQFGADFSAIRVHPGSDQPASVGADALATGDDLHFAPGAYEPHTSSGMQLIGHELAHVIQQRQGRTSQPASPANAAQPHLAGAAPPSRAAGSVARNLHVDPALEQEAEAIGDRIAAGAAVDTGDGSARSTAAQPGKRRKKRPVLAPGQPRPLPLPGLMRPSTAEKRRRAQKLRKNKKKKERRRLVAAQAASAQAALMQQDTTPPVDQAHDTPPVHQEDDTSVYQEEHVPSEIEEAPPAELVTQDPGMDLETPTDQTPTAHEARSDDSEVDEDGPGQEKDKQSDESSEQFLGRTVGAEAATAIGRKPLEHASQFEQRLRDAINHKPRRELAEDSLVLDTNMYSGVIQLMTGDRWDQLQPNKKFGVNYLRTHAHPALQPIMDPATSFGPETKLDAIIGAGYDLRAANATLGELPDNTIPMTGLKVLVPRDSEVYTLTIEILASARIGQNKGAADRSIIADMLFSEGHKPRFMTSDVDVFSRLYQSFGPNRDSDKVGKQGQDGHRISWSQLILGFYPDGFDIQIGFRKMTIIAIQGR